MHVTVAICTWNRAELLDQTLLKMRELRIPEGTTWELLVVNNNSTDQTETILAKYKDVLPLRAVNESKQGHSHARNCAVAAATGELLIWTDDDVLVDPAWLAAYVRAATEYPDADVFGGDIKPWFEEQPPRWLEVNLKDIEGAFALRTALAKGEPIQLSFLPFGANMAFRLRALREVPFDGTLGRIGNDMLGGDETTVIAALMKRSGSGVWVPDAKVRHFIPKQRMNLDYLRKFFRGYGRTMVLLQPRDGSPRICGIPRWQLKSYLGLVLKTLIHSPRKNACWIGNFSRAQTIRGMIQESVRTPLRQAGGSDQLAGLNS